MIVQTMLTTFDNPHSPFDDYEAWRSFDEINGYYSCSLLDRIAITSDELSDADYRLAIEQAIDEIIKENVSGAHIKVTREVEDKAA